MSEKPQQFSSFKQLPTPPDSDEKAPPKREKKDLVALECLLLSQMGLLKENLEIVHGEKMEPLDFFIDAIQTGWNNNPKKIAGEPAYWGPTIFEAYKMYYGVNDKEANRALQDAMTTRRIDYIAQEKGEGYMLKIVNKD